MTKPKPSKEKRLSPFQIAFEVTMGVACALFVTLFIIGILIATSI